jgi:hypothetical protein
MQAATMKFNEMEWRTDAVQASAGRVISSMAMHSKLAFQHYDILKRLSSVNDSLSELLNYLHSQEAIKILEAAAPKELERIGVKMYEVHCKVRVAAAQIRSINLGFWKRLYFSRLDKLEAYNRELSFHSEAFKATDTPLLLLSKRDQNFVLESLLSPPKPNEALRRAFGRQ